MKNLLIVTSLLFAFSALAEEKKYVPPSDSEISTNRACFQELERQGCRTIDEDPEQFRSCLSNALPSLDESCQKMMLNLYGN